MAARKTRKKTTVKAHKRRTGNGVVRVKAHCRRPPESAWKRAAKNAQDWGW